MIINNSLRCFAFLSKSLEMCFFINLCTSQPLFYDPEILDFLIKGLFLLFPIMFELSAMQNDLLPEDLVWCNSKRK